MPAKVVPQPIRMLGMAAVEVRDIAVIRIRPRTGGEGKLGWMC